MNIGDKKIVTTVKNPNTEIANESIKPTDLIKNGSKIGALHAIDVKEKKFWNSIATTNEQREKEFKADAVPMLRWLSAVGKANWNKKDKNGRPGIDDVAYTEYYLLMTNDLINMHFWEMTNYPDFQYKLMFCVGSGIKHDHQWIAAGRQNTSYKKIFDILRVEYPHLKKDDFIFWLKNSEFETFEQLCKDHGMEDKDIKDLKKVFKEVKDLWCK